MRQPAVTGIALAVFNAKNAGGNSLIAKPGGHAKIRVFVFLPDAHFGVGAEGALGNLLAGSAFFKRRTDEERLALGRHDQGE